MKVEELKFFILPFDFSISLHVQTVKLLTHLAEFYVVSVHFDTCSLNTTSTFLLKQIPQTLHDNLLRASDIVGRTLSAYTK